jgi:endonuclease/exonuclease/phosphatase family metal-dependent hydrolase
MTIRIAAYNVENLFSRAKVFDEEDAATQRAVLDAHAALNLLFAKPAYSGRDKADMIALLTTLGLDRSDSGPLAIIRKIRGRWINRPRGGAPEIVADGRSDWVGWCELRTAPVNAVAMDNTARVIRDVGADILAIVEAESRPLLQDFHRIMLPRVGLKPADGYRHVMLIDGNDDRGIDVGLATRAGHPIGTIRSHVDDRDAKGSKIFSRDSPEYAVAIPSGGTLVVIPSHFKSKFGGETAQTRNRRRGQAEAVAGIYARLRNEGAENIVVLGDLNDTPDSVALAPLLAGTDLRDVSTHPGFTEVDYRARTGGRGIGTFGSGADSNKIDYILLSPALFARVRLGGLFRKGAWPGVRPQRWEVYPELREEVHAASDHHAIWADLDL